MARKKQLIIPIFIPQYGCPHQCVFCNQSNITGRREKPDMSEVADTINLYLSTWKGSGRKEVAFYGGSFTGLERCVQETFLNTAYKFVAAGSINSIRVSTRPDYITDEILTLLKRYKAETVELGVQSMDDEVLRLSGRGHTAIDTIAAVALLKRYNIKVGLQFMPGLPGDTEETILSTADKIIGLQPDFVRIYPTVVVRDTPLADMYQKGLYNPWPLSDMVKICKRLVCLFNAQGIPIIRLGLHAAESLEKAIVAGPYHQSFRDLIHRTA